MRLCGFRLTEGGTCQRPAGHTRWSIETGWSATRQWTPADLARDLNISAYAHMSRPCGYDTEVWPYLMEPR